MAALRQGCDPVRHMQQELARFAAVTGRLPERLLARGVYRSCSPLLLPRLLLQGDNKAVCDGGAFAAVSARPLSTCIDRHAPAEILSALVHQYGLRLAARCSAPIRWQPRAPNEEADRLARSAAENHEATLVWYDAGIQALLHSMQAGSEAAVFGTFDGSWTSAAQAAGAFLWSLRQTQLPALAPCKGTIAFATSSADEAEWAAANAASITILRLFEELAGMTPFWQQIERHVYILT